MPRLRPSDDAGERSTSCNCEASHDGRDSTLIRIETVPTVIVIAGIGLSQMLADLVWVGTPTRMGALGMVYVGIAGLLIVYALVLEVIVRHQDKKKPKPKLKVKQSAESQPVQRTDAETEAISVPPSEPKIASTAPPAPTASTAPKAPTTATTAWRPTLDRGQELPGVLPGDERYAPPVKTRPSRDKHWKANPTVTHSGVQQSLYASHPPTHHRSESMFDEPWLEPPTPEILVAPEEEYRPRRAIETS